MAGNIRKGHSGAFKAKVALETVKEENSLAQLSSEFGIYANQIGQWRKQLFLRDSRAYLLIAAGTEIVIKRT